MLPLKSLSVFKHKVLDKCITGDLNYYKLLLFTDKNVLYIVQLFCTKTLIQRLVSMMMCFVMLGICTFPLTFDYTKYDKKMK